MKLHLETNRDVNILTASGEINAERFAILKAGIKKLFRDGKNKIILELPESKNFPVEILREMAQLNLMAAELAGQIVLAGIAAETKSKIESFSMPSAVRCTTNREEALKIFFGSASTASPDPKKSPAPNSTVAPPSPPTAPVGASTSSAKESAEDKKGAKEKIRQSELNDLGALRKRISELEVENKELVTSLKDSLLKRRDPPDLDSWKAKVKDLETQLEAANTQLNAAPAKKT